MVRAGVVPINSRRKGAEAEVEFGHLLQSKGWLDARRGQQYSGGSGSPDVVGVPGVHFELKRTNSLRLYDAIDQSRNDAAASGNMPVVAHRCDNDRRKGTCRGEWLAILSIEDFLELLKKAGYAQPEPGSDTIASAT